MILGEFVKELNNISSEKVEQLRHLIYEYKQIIILGNGGSSSIASHITQDYTKQLSRRAFTFSDSSRLTCYINDYGQSLAYSQFLREFSDKDTLVILISSSGNSKNILSCLEYCAKEEIDFALLTGFSNNNLCRSKYKNIAKLEYWVDSTSYGVVECAHQVFLHLVV